MKHFLYNACRVIPLLFSFLLFISIAKGQTKLKTINGIYYPQNYKIENDSKPLVLAKTNNDTLSYTTFKKNINDFDVINGCGSFGADQSNVNIARSDDGGYMCVWEDHTSGYIEIIGQLFNSNDEKIGGVLKISDQYCNWNSEPHVAFNPVTGEYIITWASSGYDILIQRISKDGIKIGSNVTATQTASSNTNNPSSAVNKNGDIMLTWYSDAGGIMDTKVYCRLFDKTLNPLNDQHIISQPPFDAISSVGWDDRIASDSLGNFIITWSSHYNNSSRIIMQQFNKSGNAVGGNIMVSDSTDLSSNISPTITGTKTGYYFFLWTSNDLLKGRIYKSDSGFVTKQFVVSDTECTWFTYGISSDENNFYVVVTGNTPYSQVINKNGMFIGKNKLAPVLSQTIWALEPRLSNGLLGTLYCVYYGYLENVQEVMIQKFDTSFEPIGAPKKLDSGNCGASQTSPVVKFNNKGGSIIIWTDRRDGTDNLYAQVFDENENPEGNNFLVNDTSFINWISNPYILPDNDGNFIILFSGGMYSNQNLIYQKISAAGEKIGGNIKLTNYYYSNVKSIAQTDSSGNILLCWYISNNSYSPLYMQKFSKDMNPITGLKTIFSGYPSPQRRYFGLSINKNLNVLVTWANYNAQYQSAAGDLKAMIFNEDGSAASDTIQVYSLSDQRLYTDGTCSLDDLNNAVFEWSDCSIYSYDTNVNLLRRYNRGKKIVTYMNTINNYNVFSKMQIINFNNAKVFAAWSDFNNINSIYLDDNQQTYIPVRLEDIEPFVFSWGVPNDDYGIDIYNNKLLIAYETIKDTSRGLDIWANVQQLDKFDFNTDQYSIFNTDALEKVSSAYPNPVTSGVSLKFQLTIQANVNISVYNILGEKIATLRNGMTEPGVYNETFNIMGLPSGIYFIYYRGIKTFAKKFIVVK